MMNSVPVKTRNSETTTTNSNTFSRDQDEDDDVEDEDDEDGVGGGGAMRGHGETISAERICFVGPGHGAALQDEARRPTPAARRVPETIAASESRRRAPALPVRAARVLPAADRLSKGSRRVAAGDGRQRFRYIRDDGVDGHRLKFAQHTARAARLPAAEATPVPRSLFHK